MGKRILSVAVSLLIVLSGLSWPVRRSANPLVWAPLREEQATGEASSMSSVQPSAARQAPDAQPLPQAQGALSPQTGDLQVLLDKPQKANPDQDIARVPVTEALDRALDVLKRETRDNEKLRQTIDSLQEALGEREQTIKGLNSQLETYTARTEKLEDALEKWKEDVLGFRDEMRKAEEAEIGVLQEILMLLRSFKEQENSE